MVGVFFSVSRLELKVFVWERGGTRQPRGGTQRKTCEGEKEKEKRLFKKYRASLKPTPSEG